MNESILAHYEEKEARTKSGMSVLILTIMALLASVAILVYGAVLLANIGSASTLGIVLVVASSIYISVFSWFPYIGLKIIKPNEALVLTLFGKY